jgi:hypothetical protein
VIPSQAEFEVLLQRLREQQTESSIVDGKADLPLETEGDRAFFIRHVAALANNTEPSHLIIGVEDKTWDPIGLSEDSPLCDSDQTQRRMNQTLANRLDPNVSVRYRTYEVSGVMLGLVAVEGTRAPYIIAIEDQQYGGDRTRGEPSYVYRGAIYVRRGANSVIANRQSEVLGTVSKAQQVTTDNSQPDEFLATCNYLDVESEGFGRHALSAHLVEAHPKAGTFGTEFVPAQSWVSFVFRPVDSGCEIDTVALKEKLRPDQRIGREGQWYHGVPRPFIDMFCNPRATPREFLGTWQPRDAEDISHFMRIRPSGHIEVGCTYPLFYQRDGVRFFGFVTLIGYLWQMVYLSRAIYRDASFHGETAFLVNLVGTKRTRLADFARSRRGGWASPFSPEYWLILTSPEQEMCHDPNIQIEQGLPLADASDDDIETMIRDIARYLGAYYGQERPRCFDYHTDEFPWRDYVQRV